LHVLLCGYILVAAEKLQMRFYTTAEEGKCRFVIYAAREQEAQVHSNQVLLY
jgi:hypothetical protein